MPYLWIHTTAYSADQKTTRVSPLCTKECKKETKNPASTSEDGDPTQINRFPHQLDKPSSSVNIGLFVYFVLTE